MVWGCGGHASPVDGPGACLDPASDGFHEAAIDPDKWQVAGGFCVGVGNGLTFVLPPNADGDLALTSVFALDLTARWAAIEALEVGNQSGNAYARFEVKLDGANSYAIQVEFGQTSFIANVAGVLSTTAAPYDPVGDRTWRIRDDATTAAFETSPDGITWNLRASQPIVGPLGQVRVQISAGTVAGGSSAPGVVRWNDFEVPCAMP